MGEAIVELLLFGRNKILLLSFDKRLIDPSGECAKDLLNNNNNNNNR